MVAQLSKPASRQNLETVLPSGTPQVGNLRYSRPGGLRHIPAIPKCSTDYFTLRISGPKVPLMGTEFDATEFVDSDFQAARKGAFASVAAAANRAPTREDVDSKVGETHQKLAELKRLQEDLERERAGLEETRRRQMEFQTGRQETIQNLTRGIGLLEEAEFAARRDAEQTAKTLVDLRESLVKVEATNEAAWTKENFPVELTKALTAIENARMEWNAARLKYDVLSGELPQAAAKEDAEADASKSLLAGRGFGELCKLGLALTWPLALVALLALGGLLAVLLRTRH